MKRPIREQAQDERDEVVVDMLSILQKIPIQVLGKCLFLCEYLTRGLNLRNIQR